VPLVPVLTDQAVIMPSYATAHSPFRRPVGWFVMGTGTARVACELHNQLQAQGRTKPLLLADADGYSSLIAWEMVRRYGIPQVVLPTNQAVRVAALQPILARDADAYVLNALPPAASSLVFAMAAVGEVQDPTRWYLGPTLHTPAFLETIPKGLLTGAHGVAPGTAAGAAEFRTQFAARWQDGPLDDAYPFYDAGAVTVLALHRAMVREGRIPPGRDLVKHIVAVTHAGGTPVGWNELAKGLALITQGQEIEYIGLTGQIEFDLSGQTPTAGSNWWTIDGNGRFEAVERVGECKVD
jgi:ABC-type branched-subunit amino acid transport system substrate-binding protein